MLQSVALILAIVSPSTKRFFFFYPPDVLSHVCGIASCHYFSFYASFFVFRPPLETWERHRTRRLFLNVAIFNKTTLFIYVFFFLLSLVCCMRILGGTMPPFSPISRRATRSFIQSAMCFGVHLLRARQHAVVRVQCANPAVALLALFFGKKHVSLVLRCCYYFCCTVFIMLTWLRQ